MDRNKLSARINHPCVKYKKAQTNHLRQKHKVYPVQAEAPLGLQFPEELPSYPQIKFKLI